MISGMEERRVTSKEMNSFEMRLRTKDNLEKSFVREAIFFGHEVRSSLGRGVEGGDGLD